MEDAPTTPSQSSPPQSPSFRPVVHTYEEDMARAMDTTEAGAVQTLLQRAKAQEAEERETVKVYHQRRWYSAAGIILLLLALSAIGYGFYYYRHLTVPVSPAASVGVFQSTDPVFVDTTDAPTALGGLLAITLLPEGKPLLVPLLSDATNRTPLTPQQTFTYLGIDADDPLVAAFSLVRLGVMNTGTTVTPFLIMSAPDPDVASKELLLAEPNLLGMVANTLHINTNDQTNEVGKDFVSSYMYNLPVRTLHTTDSASGEETILLYYGYANQHTIVIATDPTVLKAIYDTIIRQH
ncbi:MAG TPA: hypothetical protein VG621_01975 [Candidatus Paceibacterota bacterium]|nr:hypothetical protein [Candidatus Paceibacterota bacterium]